MLFDEYDRFSSFLRVANGDFSHELYTYAGWGHRPERPLIKTSSSAHCAFYAGGIQVRKRLPRQKMSRQWSPNGLMRGHFSQGGGGLSIVMSLCIIMDNKMAINFEKYINIKDRFMI